MRKATLPVGASQPALADRFRTTSELEIDRSDSFCESFCKDLKETARWRRPSSERVKCRGKARGGPQLGALL